jgi:hypothetical protein
MSVKANPFPPSYRQATLWDRAWCNQPCAAPGLISYRARGRYGWIMIGAKDNTDAMREARRSTDNPTDLQVWEGDKYVPA